MTNVPCGKGADTLLAPGWKVAAVGSGRLAPVHESRD